MFFFKKTMTVMYGADGSCVHDGRIQRHSLVIYVSEIHCSLPHKYLCKSGSLQDKIIRHMLYKNHNHLHNSHVIL